MSVALSERTEERLAPAVTETAAPAAAARPAQPWWRTTWFRGLIVPAVLVLAWELLARLGVFRPNLMPAPTVVAEDLWFQLTERDLLGHIGITTWRVLLGFGLGTAAATVLGALTGYSRTARDLLDPTLQGLKAIPSLAWVPLFILWFGIFETSKVTLIAVGVFFPIYLNLMTGIQEVDRKLVEVARINGLGRFALVRRVLLPATLPSYFVGLRAGLALGWMFVIAAELMGASKGLGFLMIDGQQMGKSAVIIGSLILFAIAGKLSDSILAIIARRTLRWRDTFGTMSGGADARHQ